MTWRRVNPLLYERRAAGERLFAVKKPDATNRVDDSFRHLVLQARDAVPLFLLALALAFALALAYSSSLFPLSFKLGALGGITRGITR